MPQQKGNGKGVAEFATGSLIAKEPQLVDAYEE
jgi:hypothetical protein